MCRVCRFWGLSGSAAESLSAELTYEGSPLGARYPSSDPPKKKRLGESRAIVAAQAGGAAGCQPHAGLAASGVTSAETRLHPPLHRAQKQQRELAVPNPPTPVFTWCR